MLSKYIFDIDFTKVLYFMIFSFTMAIEIVIFPVRGHRKKLGCAWSRIKSMSNGANDAAPGSRD